MKFDLSITLLAAAGSAAAVPRALSSTFKVKAIAAGSDIDSKTLNAAQNNLYLGLSSQGAVCQHGEQNDATFYIRDGGLYLYATKAAPQQLYADRSGMGQGKLGYSRPGQLPKNAELDGWAIDESGNLNFNGVGFIGCPSADGAWSVWINAGVDQPAGNSGCVPVIAQAVEDGKPLSCYYSELS